jgi:hypothetical protein
MIVHPFQNGDRREHCRLTSAEARYAKGNGSTNGIDNERLRQGIIKCPERIRDMHAVMKRMNVTWSIVNY